MNWLTVWLASTNAAPAENKQSENDMAYERMTEMFSLVMRENCFMLHRDNG